MASFFTKVANGSTVSIALPNPIPEESLPANQIIILELQASSKALSTNAIIVLQVLQHNNVVDTVLIHFTKTYYIGYYDEVKGLEFSDDIMLANGSDVDNIEFALYGGM